MSIASGVVIKFALGTGLRVEGTLYVNGTLANNVKFTSINDNSFGETIPGSSGNPQPGNWGRIILHRYLSNDGIEAWYPFAGKTGYFGGDVNLESQINNQDKNDLWFQNFGKSKILPE